MLTYLICFFRAIQSFNDAMPRNEEELLQAVGVAYDNYLQHKLNHTWLTLQSCFNQIIIHNGGNNYNIEHISKEKLECNGQLPDILDVVEEADKIFNFNNTDDETNETNYESNDEHKRIPILPTHKWEDGAMANGSPHRNRFVVVVVVIVVVVACMFFGVCVFFCLGHWCVCGGSFVVPKYLKYLGTSGFIFTQIILGSETPKLPAQLWYKIHVFYVGCTYQSTDEKKCCEYLGPEGVIIYVFCGSNFYESLLNIICLL